MIGALVILGVALALFAWFWTSPRFNDPPPPRRRSRRGDDE